MEVYIIPMFEDNYCYYVTRNLQTHPGILIDVAEPAKLQRFMQTMSINLEPTAIFSTHKHWDHTSGNEEMKGVFPNIQIYGGAADNVPGQTEGLQNGRVFEMNDIKITCLHTPCHTRGHMCYYFEPIEGATDGQEHTVEKLAKPYQVTRSVNRCVFTGDMIFNGGCGLFMEGTPAQMVACMELARDQLPGDTKMFDGHEYTVKNYKFAKVADPDNPAIDQVIQDNNQKIAQGLWTCPSTLDIQKATNVFMRALDADMQAITGTSNATQCMGYLRQWKSKGKRPML